MTDLREYEPIPGLPEPLPEGESILWQGSPRWRRLAVSAFHIRKVALYFALIGAWHAGWSVAAGEAPASIAGGLAALGVAALLSIGILALLAWLSARATIYTITTRRVVMRFGVALPLAVNVPFRIVASAGLRVDADGTGDLPLSVAGEDKIAYLALWPHARPWHVSRPEPMLRAVPDAAAVADILADALQNALQRPARPASPEAPSFLPPAPVPQAVPAATAA